MEHTLKWSRSIYILQKLKVAVNCHLEGQTNSELSLIDPAQIPRLRVSVVTSEV